MAQSTVNSQGLVIPVVCCAILHSTEIAYWNFNHNQQRTGTKQQSGTSKQVRPLMFCFLWSIWIKLPLKLCYLGLFASFNQSWESLSIIENQQQVSCNSNTRSITSNVNQLQIGLPRCSAKCLNRVTSSGRPTGHHFRPSIRGKDQITTLILIWSTGIHSQQLSDSV